MTQLEHSTKMPGTRRRPVPSPYERLSRWPDLAPPIALHLGMGLAYNTVRIPIKLLRGCGMDPAKGVHAATFGTRVLIRSTPNGGPFQQEAASKQMRLPSSGLDDAVSKQNFAIVEGPDYLVLTTREDAHSMADGVPAQAWDAPRLDATRIATVAGKLDLQGLEILSWRDVVLRKTRQDRSSVIAHVVGPVWTYAGFSVGSPIRFTRYEDATVVELCEHDAAHSEVSGDGPYLAPRHFVGPSLLDCRGISAIRAIATPNALILTQPESDIGRRCNAQDMYMPHANRKPSLPDPAAVASLRPFVEDVTVLQRNVFNAYKGECVRLGKRFLSAAGLCASRPMQVSQYTDALVFEASDAGHSPPNALALKPFQHLTLKRTLMFRDTKSFRGLAVAGKVILVPLESAIGTEELLGTDSAIPAPLPVDGVRQPHAAFISPTFQVNAGRVHVSGRVWDEAGFLWGDPARILRLPDMLVIEKCSAEAAEFRVGTKSDPRPYRNVSLRDTGLQRKASVQADAQPGRVVLSAGKTTVLSAGKSTDRARATWGLLARKPLKK